MIGQIAMTLCAIVGVGTALALIDLFPASISDLGGDTNHLVTQAGEPPGLSIAPGGARIPFV